MNLLVKICNTSLAGIVGRPGPNIKAWCRDPTGGRARDGTEGGISVIVALNCGMDVDPEIFINSGAYKLDNIPPVCCSFDSKMK